MESKKLNVLIVGATGKLGALITKHVLLQPNLIANILIRNPKKNPELMKSVQEAGGKVLQGDLGEVETLKDVTKGMHTVISTIYPPDEKTFIIGQFALIDDCLRNGVERFVPSDFGGDIKRFTPEELAESLSVGLLARVHDYLKGKPIKTLHFWQGIFAESFFEFPEASSWGNPEHKYDLTTYEDTAKVVAAAVAQENRIGDVVIVGESLTLKEIIDVYNKVRGTSLVAKKKRTFEELKVEWNEAIKTNGPKSYEAMFFDLLNFILDDRHRLLKTNNSEFSDIRLTTVEEFLVQNPYIQLPS